jgi:hypothetical protein
MPKLVVFSAADLGSLLAGNNSFAEKWPSSSGNVNFANGQTDRILLLLK